MTRQRRTRILKAAGLGVVCAALGWLDLYLYTGSNGPVEPVLATERDQVEVAPLPPQPSFSMAAAEDFAEIVERPIFSPTRRPPEALPETATEVDAPSLDVVLEGVVITEAQRLALLRPEAGGPLVRVPEGERILGWAVVAVTPYSVTVRRGEEESTLELRFDTPSPVPTQPTRKVSRRKPTAPPPRATATAPSTATAGPPARP
jgi:hypothetical protein